MLAVLVVAALSAPALPAGGATLPDLRVRILELPAAVGPGDTFA
jgi:hypothetical protein